LLIEMVLKEFISWGRGNERLEKSFNGNFMEWGFARIFNLDD